MNNDTFTGFTPDEASKQIIEFFAKCVEAGLDTFYYKGVEPFYHTLQKVWCSPKAVDFGNKYLPRLNALHKKIIYVGATICFNATTAYNSLAEANNLPSIQPSYDDNFPNFSKGFTEGDPKSLDLDYLVDYDGTTFELYKVSPNGIVGMNHLQVKQAMELFKSIVSETIGKLNDLPMDIAFYDPNGEMKYAYKDLINKLVEEINSEISEIITNINTALDTEVDNIMLAKEQATHTLNG